MKNLENSVIATPPYSSQEFKEKLSFKNHAETVHLWIASMKSTT